MAGDKSAGDTHVFAYKMSDKSRDRSKEFWTRLSRGSDRVPAGIWSDGDSTMWIANPRGGLAHASPLPGGARPVYPEAEEVDTTGVLVETLNVGNHPVGVWGDEHALWVIKSADADGTGPNDVVAYDPATNQRLPDLGFDLYGGPNFHPGGGAWSNGETVWISDSEAAMLFAYDLPGGSFDTDSSASEKNFKTLDAAGNDSPAGIWSDGETMWVADKDDRKIYAYRMDNHERDPGKEINLTSHSNHSAGGIWSDGEVMWVGVDCKCDGPPIHAYDLETGERVPDRDIDPANLGPYHGQWPGFPKGLWSDGETMWVANPHNPTLRGFQLPGAVEVDPPALASATVSGTTLTLTYDKDLDSRSVPAGGDFTVRVVRTSSTFDRNPTGVSIDGGTVTLTLNLTVQSGDTVTISYTPGTNPIRDTRRKEAPALDGHSVTNLSSPPALQEARVAGTSLFLEYDLALDQDSTPAGSDYTVSITASDSTTSAKTVSSVAIEDNEVTLTLASEVDAGDTVTVSYTAGANPIRSGNGINAADLSGQSVTNESAKPVLQSIVGIGQVVMLTYDLALTQDPVPPASSFTLTVTDTDGVTSTPSIVPGVLGKTVVLGLHASASLTSSDSAVLSYTAGTNPIRSGNGSKAADFTNQAVTNNTLNPAKKLSALTLTDVTLNRAFSGGLLSYTGWATASLEETTVAATAADSTSAVVILPADSDSATDGHQVDLSGIETGESLDVTVTVTPADTNISAGVYTVTVTKRVAARAPFYRDLRTPELDIPRDAAGGVWSDGVIIWVARDDSVAVQAYLAEDYSRVEGLDWRRHADNGDPVSMASDGETMWVLDGTGRYIYAYTGFADGQAVRVPASEFITSTLTGTGNDNPRGIWTNGATMWVADDSDGKVYAYNVSDNQRAGGKDFDLDSKNGNARGIWSNGRTMWVADGAGQTIYAYGLADGSRRSSYDLGRHRNQSRIGDLWGNGLTLWALDWRGRRLLAYDLPAAALNTGLASVNASGNVSVWSNGAHIWVGVSSGATSKLHAYTLQDMARDSSRDIAVGHGIEDMWSDGETAWILDGSQRMRVYDLATGVRSAGREFQLASDNANTRGIWSDGETIWVADGDDEKLYAYTLDGGARDSDKDINISHNDWSQGIWSDGETIWVADSNHDRIYAYRLEDGSRAAALDIPLAAGHDVVTGLWSDGNTMWAADKSDQRLYAYELHPAPRTAGFTTMHADIDDPTGIWSDGRTMWVTDWRNTRVYGIDMQTGELKNSENWLAHTNNNEPESLWSDGKTIWRTDTNDSRIYSYNISDKSWKGNASDYDVGQWGNDKPRGIWTDGTTMWVSDGDDRKIYAYRMSNQNRDSSKDFNTLDGAGNDAPRGIWSDGAYMWVADQDDNRLYAYRMDTKARIEILDVVLSGGNQRPRDIWSDGKTIWVLDNDDEVIYSYPLPAPRPVFLDSATNPPAGVWSDGETMWVIKNNSRTVHGYDAVTGARKSSEDWQLDGGNNRPVGIWSDGTTIWVAENDNQGSYAKQIYAYDMSDKSRNVGVEFQTLDAAGNDAPWGIWSDGATMWVVDRDDDKVYAYSRTNTFHEPAKDIDLDPANEDPRGVWSDGVVIWVADSGSDKAYAYDLRRGGRVSSRDLLLPGVNADARDIWSDGRTIWVADSGDNAIYRYTLPQRAGARPGDFATASGNSAPNGAWSDGRTLWVTQSGSGTVFGYDLATNSHDSVANWELASGNRRATGMWSDGSVIWVVDRDDDKVYSYNYGDKSAAARDFDLATGEGNDHARDIWSDGATAWVLDEDAKVYAYNLSDGSRDADGDFYLLNDNAKPRGMWSDGTTLWVCDQDDPRVYAYNLEGRAYNVRLDIELTGDNGNCLDIWSDGVTAWVVDNDDDKVYAYELPVAEAAGGQWATENNNNPSAIWSDGVNVWVGKWAADTMYGYTPTGLRDSGSDWTLDGDNRQPQGAWSDGETIWVSDAYRDKLFAYKASDKSRDASRDIALNARRNLAPRGVWSDGVTLWVADEYSPRLFAYDLATGGALPARDIALSAKNDAAHGLSGDGVTVWVSDKRDNKLYAYNLLSGAYEPDLDIAVGSSSRLQDVWTDGSHILVADQSNDTVRSFPVERRSQTPAGLTFRTGDNDEPIGMWSDGTTLWTTEWPTRDVRAYVLHNGNRRSSKDKRLHSDNTNPEGMWSDGATMWVVDSNDHKVYAYSWPSMTRDIAKENNLLNGYNDKPTGVWSDADYFYVMDRDDSKIYAYKTSDKSHDNNRAFVDPNDVGNDSGNGIWSDGRTMWVADADKDRIYAYSMRGNARHATMEIKLGGGNDNPRGIWSDGVTMWVADASDDRIYTYPLPSYVPRRDYDVHRANGVWSDGAHFWVNEAGNSSRNVRAYNLRTGNRVTSQEWKHSNNYCWQHESDGDCREFISNIDTAITLWSNNRLWISTTSIHHLVFAYWYDSKADRDGKDQTWSAGRRTPGIWGRQHLLLMVGRSDDRVYAHHAWNGDRFTSEEFDLQDPNDHPWGIWSDNDTVWVVDESDNKLYAYERFGSHARRPRMDLTLRPGNDKPGDVWSDGHTIWVADRDDHDLYAYALPHKTKSPTSAFASVGKGPPELFQATAAGAAQVDLLWTTPASGKATGYDIEWSADGETWQAVDPPDDGADTIYSHTGLTPETTYYYRMRYVTEDGPGDWTDPTAATTAPDTWRLTATASSETQIELSWTPPEGEVTVYLVEWSADGRSGWAAVEPAHSGTEAVYSHTGLTADTAYHYRVRAVIGRFPGPWSPAAGASTASWGLAAASVGETQIDLAWTPPGGEFTGYELEWSADGRTGWTAVEPAHSGTESIYSHTGLTPDTAYHYRVRGVNDDGPGLWGILASATTHVANGLPTGAPAITGTAQVGGTLTADASGISDANGLTGAAFSYQWLAGNAVISGATDSAYTLTPAEGGQPIRVRVTFTDDAGNEETVTSAATPAALTPVATIMDYSVSTGAEGDARVELIWRAPDGSEPTGYYVEWSQGEVYNWEWVFAFPLHSGTVTGYAHDYLLWDTTYYYRVRAMYGWDEGDWSPVFAATTTERENNPATGAPAIIGGAQVGETLTADTSGIADEDGLDHAVFGYQWLADGAEISGATGSNYALSSDDDGKTISLAVTFIDDAINEESLTSAATAAVAAAQTANTPATGAPTISGTAQEGQTLTADTSGIADEDGLDNVTFAYQWQADGGDISVATDSTYTPVADDVGKAISVTVSFTDDAGNEEELTSAATDAVEAKPNNPATGAPTVSGTAQVGETLTADTSAIADEDGLEDATFSYQWLADGSETQDATDATYTPVVDDVGKAMSVTVTFTDDAGNEEELTSAATDAVEAKPNSPATGALTISGTARVGETLTAETSAIADKDGLEDATFSYQWLADDTDISGATGLTYTLVDADEGKAVSVRVSFTDDAGNEETLTSAATAAVVAAAEEGAEPTDRPHGLTAEASDGAVVLTWNAPEGYTYDYQIQRHRPELGETEPLVYVEFTEAYGVTTYTDTEVEAGVLYVYRVTTIDFLGDAGEASSPAQIRMPATSQQQTANNPATGAPTITGKAQVGETLTADTSGISDDDGLSNAAFSYQWLADSTDIAGATGSTYTLVDADEGKAVSVKVSFTDDAGTAETLTSAATAAVVPGTEEAQAANSPATGAPAITGTAQVGETLTANTSGIADEDGLTNAVFSYQWQADDSNISGATGETYTLADADEGKAISVTVSFTDDAGNAETLASAATDAVEAAPLTPLTAVIENAAASHDGESVFTFELRFSEEFGISYKTLRDHAFTVSGGTVRKAQRIEQGSNIGWRITVRPDGNGDVTIVLPETTDCESQGAICTEDGRMLSTELELTVSGP